MTVDQSKLKPFSWAIFKDLTKFRLMTTTAFSACVGAGLQILWAGGVMNWTDYVLLGVGTACFALGAGVQNQIAEVLDQRDAHLLQQLHVPFSIWPSTKAGLRVRFDCPDVP